MRAQRNIVESSVSLRSGEQTRPDSLIPTREVKTELRALWGTRLTKAIQRTTDFFRGVKRVLIWVTKRGSKWLNGFEPDVLRNISDYDMNNLLNLCAGVE